MMMAAAGDNERKSLIESILAEPVLARLATSNPKTMQPHVVPVWFLWDGEFIWVSSFMGTRKISELKNNPRGAILIESKQPNSKLQVVLIEGTVELVTEPREVVSAVSSRIYERYLGAEGVKDPEPQSWLNNPKNLLIKLTPKRIISW
jgi:nitroimidazol reductase NimA-like FMN-containing flavoprotein (pyridoxamine 5'-phosphate oxidase superfamily)